MGEKFTPSERSIVLVMHERTVREIRVNGNTALNLEDVIENVTGIETVVRVASCLLKWIFGGKNNPKYIADLQSLQQKLSVRVKIHLVILL